MKKTIALIMALVMVACTLSACGSGKETSTTNTATTTTNTAANTAAANTTSNNTAATATTGSSAPDWTAYNDLITKIKTSTDFTAREALLHQAEDMLMDTGAVCPIYYYNDLYMQKKDVSGIYGDVYGNKYFMYASSPRKVLKINLASEPAHLDPALNSSVDGACLIKNSFAGLFTYDDQGALQKDLCKDYKVSDDGMTYTFTLEDGLKWSDGSDLTAQDFVYAWKRAASPDTAADYAYMFSTFDGYDKGDINVTAPDDKTIVATLIAPCAYFLDLCAFPTYMPLKQSAVEAASDWKTNPGSWASEAGFVSNGAYTLKSWKHEESMVYVKNKYYHNADKVKVEELDFMLSADDTAIFAAYNAGDLDFADTVPTNEISNLKSNPEFHIIPNLGTYYIAFNVNSQLFAGKTTEQANDMRKAIGLLIDRQYIIDNVGQCNQEEATSFIPSGMSDGHGGIFKSNDADYTYQDKDSCGYYSKGYSDDKVNQARELLKKAGYEFNDDGTLSDSTPISFTYLTNDGTGHVAIAEAIQQDVAVIGIDMQIETHEWNVFLDERKQGKFDVAREGWLADFNDPINMLEMWTTESGNNDCQFGK